MKHKSSCFLIPLLGFASAVPQASASDAVAPQRDFMNHIYDYIENPDVFELNQEESHAYFIPQHHKLLNGQWQFLYASTPEGIPDGFYKPNAQVAKWHHIQVPSNWEMEGWGDPMFRNVPVPFKANPPFVPHEYNPTGAYRTTFTVPSDWQGEEVFLRFEKVASASFLWINGQEVGYNEGAQEPSEYDITPYLKKGTNTLAMMVIKYSDGYYMEDQDYWRLAGIFDDVWLYATPKTRLFDWYVTTDLDHRYRDAELAIEATAVQYADASNASLKVTAQLFDAQDRQIASFESPASNAWTQDKHLKLNLSQHISDPLKWTAETPNLYTLRMKLTDAQDRVIDQAEQVIGFKETEMRDNVFYLNGQKIKVNAICSHMQDPVTGHVVGEELIHKDMTILKQFGFNGVRTSHYPPVPSYLRLANEYGLYIIDEAGVEAHATEQISHDPRFAPMYRERVRRMVLRDRNQPCILFWSAGNESGEGQNIAEVIDEGRKYDRTRWWMYGGNAYSHPAEDIIGPRYPTPLALDMKVGHHHDGDVRPSFMDEYISVAGNAGGNMDEMWRAVYQYDRTIGGAVWDFVSPGLLEQERSLTDGSPLHVQAQLMGRAQLKLQQAGKSAQKKNSKTGNHVLDVNGHDQWVEVYRDPRLDLNVQSLTLSFDAMPRELNASSGTFITKGSWQLGVKQEGADKLRFYLTTDKAPESQDPRVRSWRYMLDAPLPSDWYNQWHHIQASYDGHEMTLQLDGNEVRMAAAGQIVNAPYPLCIGRNAQTHNADTDEYLCDAQIDNVAIFAEALPADSQTADRALLWLDFEQETPGRNYYSYGSGARTYGTIWPDRTIQPEIHQMKKSTQPIVCRLINAESGTLEVWNRNPFLNASHYSHTWALTEDGRTLLSGDLVLDVAPLSRQLVKLPCLQNRPDLKPGCEYRLMIESKLKADQLWAPAGHIVAWDQIELPWSLPAAPLSDATVGQATLVRTADSIIVTGKDFRYGFTADGQLVGMEIQGKQLLASPLKVNFWRAPIANEIDGWGSFNVRYTRRDDWNGLQIANEWFSNHLDASTYMPISCEARELDGQIYIDVRCFTLYGSRAENKQLDTYISGTRYNGLEEVYQYRINGDGCITLHHTIAPEGEQPALLPRIGLTLALNEDLQQVEYYGRGPEENYPDRKTGYPIGIYQTTVDDMYEPYLIPQDHALRCDNRYLTLSDANGLGLRVAMDQPFNFNAYPYSTDQLTRATYQYQLHREPFVTLNLDYATTGVGCTCCYVLPSYQARAQRYERTITIRPIR